MTQTPRPKVQDPDPPNLELLAGAVLRLRAIFDDPGRTLSEKKRAVDAIGRALLRVKAALDERG
jgi:hypothetical protein